MKDLFLPIRASLPPETLGDIVINYLLTAMTYILNAAMLGIYITIAYSVFKGLT